MKFTPKLNDHWQSPYLKKYVSASFKKLLQDINTSQDQYYTKKQFKIEEDPWDNYLYYDAKHLIHLICHHGYLPISHQVVLAKFIEETVVSETISQYQVSGSKLLDELLKFAGEFEISTDNRWAGDRNEPVDEIIDSDDEEIES